ncbi:MAG: hypothetical protein ACPGR5_07930, partial [Chitinophagales bacterium]
MSLFLKFVTIILGVIITINAKSQSLDRQIISNAGEYQESASYSLNFTIGEPITSYEESGSFKITQGFQQASSETENDGTTSIKEKEIIVDYKLFPNPTTDFIALELSSTEYIIFYTEVINVAGQSQTEQVLFSNNEPSQKINVSKYANGKY